MGKVDGLEGAIVQGWTLLKEIGRGADGIVYSGEYQGKKAAIKLFFPEALAKNGWPAARERLDLQLSLVGRKHSNLVEIYAGGEDAQLGTLYLVMELVPGKSLDKLLGQIPPTEIPSLAAQLASAAQYLETLDLYHRDIKPANIIISDDFKLLTLLDLGVIHRALADDDDQGRLSGLEFVATLRYSPPEFVYREEESNVDGAWRAVTFYQIGATLHDLIMGKPLFSGFDTPRAKLYDAVRNVTPELDSSKTSSWLVQTARACLLKDWRQRLQHVSWTSFSEPPPPDALTRESRIRVLQLQREERRRAQESPIAPLLGPTKEQQLWLLNDALIGELRKYLRASPVFPLCCVDDTNTSSSCYETRFQFDENGSLGFGPNVCFAVRLQVSQSFPEAVALSFDAKADGRAISSAEWTEMFTADVAFARCRQAILDAVEAMISA